MGLRYKPLAIIEPRPPVDYATERRKRSRDGWITLCITAFLTGVLVAHVIKTSGAQRVVERACPNIDVRLNPYERELQQRECEARASRR